MSIILKTNKFQRSHQKVRDNHGGLSTHDLWWICVWQRIINSLSVMSVCMYGCVCLHVWFFILLD